MRLSSVLLCFISAQCNIISQHFNMKYPILILGLQIWCRGCTILRSGCLIISSLAFHLCLYLATPSQWRNVHIRSTFLYWHSKGYEKKEILCHKIIWRALPGTRFYISVLLMSIYKINAAVSSVRPISTAANLIGAILKREKIDIAEVHTGIAILSSPSSCTMESTLFSPLSLPHKPRSRCNVGWH